VDEWDISAKDRASYEYEHDGDYVLGPESMPQTAVPAGTITASMLKPGLVFPGNPHDYWVYRPAGEGASAPADLLVVLDGLELAEEIQLPNVLDNLIHCGDLPPIVGVFVGSGPNGPGYPIYGGNGNRAVEYDAVGDSLARFLVDELLPAVEQEVAITDNPERRGILGASSGGAAAFGVAWQRPDSFRKVLSAIGSFVNIDGAHEYGSLVRRHEQKPLRVFLQAGSNDLNTVFGHWHLANLDMAAALEYREYDYRLEDGDGGHSVKHIAAILPDALRWLWRD
jgi:enterochelin esterase-like enzyme